MKTKYLILLSLALMSLMGLSACEIEDSTFSNVRFVDETGIPYGIPKADNKPRVSSMPYTYDIAEGNIANHSSINKFGHNPTVAGVLETVWTGSNLYPWMTVADQMELLSGSINDDVGGTGAITLELFGLDSSYNPISEMISLNGTAPVTTTLSYFRNFRAIIRSAGSTGWNVGVITIRDQDIGTTRAIIDANKNQTLMAVYTIPAGYTGYITSWYAGSVASKDTQIELYIRPFGEVFQVKRNMILNNAIYDEYIDFPEVATEKSDIEVRALSGGGGGDVSAGFFLWIELD